jgi:hypothetical protein
MMVMSTMVYSTCLRGRFFFRGFPFRAQSPDGERLRKNNFVGH